MNELNLPPGVRPWRREPHIYGPKGCIYTGQTEDGHSVTVALDLEGRPIAWRTGPRESWGGGYGYPVPISCIELEPLLLLIGIEATGQRLEWRESAERWIAAQQRRPGTEVRMVWCRKCHPARWHYETEEHSIIERKK